MKKAAIYARYSSDKQSGDSIKVQVEKSRDFCERQGFPVSEVFTDEARTGTTQGGRTEYARMLDTAESGSIDAIVAYKYDRIGRSFVETVRSIYELEHFYGVQVCSATEPNEPLVAEFERRYIDAMFRRHGGNISRAAKQSGIDRRSLHRMLAKHAIVANAEGIDRR